MSSWPTVKSKVGGNSNNLCMCLCVFEYELLFSYLSLQTERKNDPLLSLTAFPASLHSFHYCDAEKWHCKRWHSRHGRLVCEFSWIWNILQTHCQNDPLLSLTAFTASFLPLAFPEGIHSCDSEKQHHKRWHCRHERLICEFSWNSNFEHQQGWP